MKSYLIVISATAAMMASPVIAADMPTKASPVPPPAFNWTGCYLGGQLGGQWGRWTANVSYPAAGGVAASRTFDGDGSIIIGGQLAFDFADMLVGVR